MIKRFLLNIFLILFPVTLIVTLINYTIDPANIFSTNLYIENIAAILSKGHNVDNVSNYDERLLQEQMIHRLNYTPDVVVLGSSRIMQVGADFFPQKRVLNCGVSHANIKDIYAIVGLLDSMKKMPAEILLNVDPGLICKFSSNEWESLDIYYKHFISTQFNDKSSNYSGSQYILRKRISSLFSIQYFQSAVLFLSKKRSKKYTDVGDRLPVSSGRLADGTIAYSYEYMHPDTAVIANNAARRGKESGAGEIDTAQRQLFEKLLDYLKSKNIKVTLCMMPFHPEYYKATNEYHQQQFINYTLYYKDLAFRKRVPIKGNFDGSAYSISESAFYDDSHSSKESLKKILTQQ